jgi:16S rRNA processing protein RimM
VVEGVSVGDFVVVGRIGRAHGLKGELFVEPRTDEPERRFAAGQVLGTGAASLTVAASRTHSGRLVVAFEEIADRTAAEASRGTELTCLVDPDEMPEDPDEFYDHQLEGLRVVTTDGRLVGNVNEVLHTAAGELLSVASETGAEVLVPFVSAIVTGVSLEDRTIEIDPPEGLLELG